MRSWNDLSRTERAEVALAGAFGGMAPLIVGMARQLIARDPGPLGYTAYDPASWLGCLFVGIVAAGVAWCYKEVRPEKALALGAAAPALVLGFAAGGSGSASAHNLLDGLGPTPLFAQVVPGPTRTADTVRVLDSVWVSLRELPGFQTREGMRPRVTYELGGGGGPVEGARLSQALTRDASGRYLLTIPEGARALSLSLGRESSLPLDLAGLGWTHGDSLVLGIDRRELSFWTRLGRPFGFRPNPEGALVLTVLPEPIGR